MVLWQYEVFTGWLWGRELVASVVRCYVGVGKDDLNVSMSLIENTRILLPLLLMKTLPRFTNAFPPDSFAVLRAAEKRTRFVLVRR